MYAQGSKDGYFVWGYQIETRILGMDVAPKIFSTQDAIFIVAVPDPKPTPAWIAFSIAHREAMYMPDDGLGTRLQ